MPRHLHDYLREVQSLVHDSTFSAWSRAEFLRRINDARWDVSNDCQCVKTLVKDAQLMRHHEIYPYDGAVVGVTIDEDERGDGYSGRYAHVEFSPPAPGGVRAKAIAHIEDRDDEDIRIPDGGDPTFNAFWGVGARKGQVRWIEMTRWGKGYTQPPTIAVIDHETGANNGAKPHPIVMFDVINVMSISPLWNTLRYTMSFRGFTVFQAWARALQAQGFVSRPGIWTIRQTSEREVFMDPVPDQTYRSEWDIVRRTAPLVGLNDVETEIPAPFDQAVQFKAAGYLMMKHQNFGLSEYYEQKYDAYVPRLVAGAGGIRITNPYSRSFYGKMRRA